MDMIDYLFLDNVALILNHINDMGIYRANNVP